MARIHVLHPSRKKRLRFPGNTYVPSSREAGVATEKKRGTAIVSRAPGVGVSKPGVNVAMLWAYTLALSNLGRPC